MRGTGINPVIMQQVKAGYRAPFQGVNT